MVKIRLTQTAQAVPNTIASVPHKKSDEHTADTHAQFESHQDSNTHHEQVSAQQTYRQRSKIDQKTQMNSQHASKRNLRKN
jgi:hypothetical protein